MKHKEFFHKEKPKKDEMSAELKMQEEFPCGHCGRVFEVEWKLKVICFCYYLIFFYLTVIENSNAFFSETSKQQGAQHITGGTKCQL